MAQTDIAYVRIDRIRVTKTQEGTIFPTPGGDEPGSTHEWWMRIRVNGQQTYWGRHGIETGKTFRVGKDFPAVPLIDGKINIGIDGWEQDTFGDTELSGRYLTIDVAENIPYGVSQAWTHSYSSSAYTDFPAEEGFGLEGGFDFQFTIWPVSRDRSEETQAYVALFQNGPEDEGYYVGGWDDFATNLFQWRSEGLELKRIASCEADPGRPTFSSSTAERTYLGVFGPGPGFGSFGKFELEHFRKTAEGYAQDGLRLLDVYAYWDDGTAYVGAAVTKGEPTKFAAAPRRAFEDEWSKRKDNGERLISIDTFHNGRERILVGLYERGSGSGLWVGAGYTEFQAKIREFRGLGFTLVDICTYNEGSELFFCGVWIPGEGVDFVPVYYHGWDYLQWHIDFNWQLGRNIVALDSWSSKARD